MSREVKESCQCGGRTSPTKVEALRETSPRSGFTQPQVTEDGIDLSLLQDSIAKTPWERMLANDDALNFGDTLREAMTKRHAKPE
jgi:hypothetical protein